MHNDDYLLSYRQIFPIKSYTTDEVKKYLSLRKDIMDIDKLITNKNLEDLKNAIRDKINLNQYICSFRFSCTYIAKTI